MSASSTDAIRSRYAKVSRQRRLCEMRADPLDRAHGTVAGYGYGCRCERCRRAESVYMGRYKRARRAREDVGPWGRGEVRNLVLLWGRYPVAGIARMLGRSPMSVAAKAGMLGLRDGKPVMP